MPLPKLPRSKWALAIAAALCVSIMAIILILPAKQPPAPPAPVATPAPAAPPPAPPPALDETSTTILELFNPSDASLTSQHNETAIRQRIEHVLTTSYVLTHCQLITNDDYRDNYHALIAYIQQANLAPDAATAEKTLRLISESARTSYTLIYSRTPCDNPQLPTIAAQLLAWQKPYLK